MILNFNGSFEGIKVKRKKIKKKENTYNMYFLFGRKKIERK